MFYDPQFPFSKTICEVFVSFERKVPLIVLIDKGQGRSVTNALEEIVTSLLKAEPRLNNVVPRVLHRDSEGEWASVTFNTLAPVTRPTWKYLPPHLAHREIHLHTHPLHLPGIPKRFFFKTDAQQRLLNVDHHHKHHSTDALSWGYLGSGPKDLAINILAKFLPVTKSSTNVQTWGGTWVNIEVVVHAQAFAEDFLATMPKEGGTIERRAIRHWLKEKRKALKFV